VRHNATEVIGIAFSAETLNLSQIYISIFSDANFIFDSSLLIIISSQKIKIIRIVGF